MELNSVIYPAPPPSISIYQFLGDDDPDVQSQLLLVDALDPKVIEAIQKKKSFTGKAKPS